MLFPLPHQYQWKACISNISWFPSFRFSSSFSSCSIRIQFLLLSALTCTHIWSCWSLYLSFNSSNSLIIHWVGLFMLMMHTIWKEKNLRAIELLLLFKNWANILCLPICHLDVLSWRPLVINEYIIPSNLFCVDLLYVIQTCPRNFIHIWSFFDCLVSQVSWISQF